QAQNTRLLGEAHEAALRQRAFLKDVLVSVTEGRLRLCDTADMLPPALPAFCGPVALTREAGLRTLRAYAMEAARLCGLPEARRMDLVTGASEAGMNAITHGGGGSGQ